MTPSTEPSRRHARSPDEWRAALAEVRLPLLSARTVLSRALSPDASLGDVASVLEADPPLAIDVLPLAARAPRVDGRLRSLQQAVNLIGVSRIQALLQARVRWQAEPHPMAQSLYIQALETSHLATQLVTAWACQKHAGDLDHLVWATWLMGVTRWKLPWVDAHACQRMALRVAAGERRANVERDELGCDVDALNAWHLQDIGLGDASELRQAYLLTASQMARAARLGWTGDFPPDVPASLARDLHRPTTGCALAYALALETEHAWYGQRLQHLMSVASAHLVQPVFRVRQQAISQALTIARSPSSAAPAGLVAEKLLWPAPPPMRVLPVTRKAAAAQPVDTTQQQPPAAGFLERCTRSDFNDLGEFLSAAQRCLSEELGLGRHALFLRQGNTGHLVCQLALGMDMLPPLKSIGFVWADHPITRKLMEHPAASLWVRPAQVAAARARLPDTITHWCSDGGFALLTVNVNSQPAGLWWVAAAGDEDALDEPRLRSLRQVVHAFGIELTRQMRKRRRSAVAP